MDRIKLNPPKQYAFETKLKIRISEINYGNHLANDAILGLVHEARLQFLKQFGYTEIDLEGKGLIMADVGIQYKNQAFHGDELLCKVAACHPGKMGFSMYYELSNPDKGQVVALAKTGMVCFDYNQRKIAKLPEKAVQQLFG